MMQRRTGRNTCLPVAFALPVLLAAVAHGGGFTEQVRTYDMTVQLENQEISMVRRTSWTRVQEDGHDAWRVSVEHQSADLPTSVDTVFLAAEDLRPLRRHFKQNNMRTRLHYTKDAVRGSVWLEDGQEMPVNVALDTPVVGDVLTTLATLPLAPQYSTTLSAFDPTLIAVRRWKILTGLVEVVDTPLGPIETYPVELSDADRPGRSALYWVTRASPHHLVKSESELPASYGGGMETATLKSVSPLPSPDPTGQ